MKDTTSRSEELFNLYEELPGVGEGPEEEPAVDARTGKPLEEIYGASQWRLIWRKFRRNKAASTATWRTRKAAARSSRRSGISFVDNTRWPGRASSNSAK